MKMKIYTILLLFIILLEAYIVLKNDDDINNKQTVEVFNKIEEKVTIDKIMGEINKEKDIKLMNIIMESDTYLIRVGIEGTKEEFTSKMKGLEKFLIKDYKLEVNDGVINGVITLNYSTKGEF